MAGLAPEEAMMQERYSADAVMDAMRVSSEREMDIEEILREEGVSERLDWLADQCGTVLAHELRDGLNMLAAAAKQNMPEDRAAARKWFGDKTVEISTSAITAAFLRGVFLGMLLERGLVSDQGKTEAPA